MYNQLLIRYGEISLKGRNRKRFEDVLIHNIRYSLRHLAPTTIRREFGRLYLELGDNSLDAVTDLLRKDVFGIVSVSPVLQTELSLASIQQGAMQVFGDRKPQTFKVETRRPNKAFCMSSPQINAEVGAFILRNSSTPVSVDVHQPQLSIQIEIRKEGVFVYGQTIPGLGGLPSGVSGTGLLLLSGGIDSPVAGFLSIKRGVVLEAIHFFSYPFTSERAKDKVVQLASMLSTWNYNQQLQLHVAYFTHIQKALQSHPTASLRITLMRRLMLRIAEATAIKRKAKALISGESLGQVASQTMESIYAINAVTNMPIFRPLIGMDKQEIIDLARKIDTYETSILPYEDCCTVFVPKDPATRPRLEQAVAAEARLDIPALIEEAIDRTEILTVSPQ